MKKIILFAIMLVMIIGCMTKNGDVKIRRHIGGSYTVIATSVAEDGYVFQPSGHKIQIRYTEFNKSGKYITSYTKYRR